MIGNRGGGNGTPSDTGARSSQDPSPQSVPVRGSKTQKTGSNPKEGGVTSPVQGIPQELRQSGVNPERIFQTPEGLEEVRALDHKSLYKFLPERGMDIVVDFYSLGGKWIETRELFDRDCFVTLSPDISWRWPEIGRVTT